MLSLNAFARLCFLALPLSLLCRPGAAKPVTQSCSNSTNEYDFIVVGGGTAGLAVATRLSQRLDACILIVEAGEAAPDEPKINIPALKGSALGTPYDWNFTTVPQPHALDRVFAQNRGKVLGGTSALNLLIWDRAARAEYSWEELGNPGWSWESMLRYMHRAENYQPTPDKYDNAGPGRIGTGGPVDVVVDRINPPQQVDFLPVLEGMGVPENRHSLDGNPLGIGYQPDAINASHYVRSYSANAYLPLARENLIVMTGTRVSRISLQKTSGTVKATGICLEDGTEITARQEVILSAGTFQSPGLLELSGIGQAAVLKAAGVEPVLELEGVGENLQDHLRVQNAYLLKPNYTSLDQVKHNATYEAQQMALYNDGKKSYYDYAASLISFQTWSLADHDNVSYWAGLATQALGKSTSVVDQKKLQYLTTHLSNAVPQLEVFFSDGNSGANDYPANNSALYGRSFFTIYTAITHALARGSVHINSSSIDARPVIDPHYLDNEYDIQALVFGAKLNRRIAQTAPLRETWEEETDPGVAAVHTEEQWRTFALNSSFTLYHPMGTCAMLPQADGGVVDARLVVHGTRNLRVVDASIIPVLLSGHPQSAVYGIAEKAADLIVEDHGYAKKRH